LQAAGRLKAEEVDGRADVDLHDARARIAAFIRASVTPTAGVRLATTNRRSRSRPRSERPKVRTEWSQPLCHRIGVSLAPDRPGAIAIEAPGRAAVQLLTGIAADHSARDAGRFAIASTTARDRS